jgi:hypothetical protein
MEIVRALIALFLPTLFPLESGFHNQLNESMMADHLLTTPSFTFVIFTEGLSTLIFLENCYYHAQ